VKKKALLVFGLAIMMILTMSIGAYAVDDLNEFPAEVDPQSWQLVSSMTWDDLREHPTIDWMNDENLADDVLNIHGLVILVDFADQPFVMTMPKGSDFMGNPQVAPIAEDELADFYETLLNIPSEINHYTSINEFWRENSYGKWAIELDVVGPYHLEGDEWEYGCDSKQNAPATKRSIINETVQAFLADDGHVDLSHYDFGFICHAGYDESNTWQEAGEMLFDTKEEATDEYGPRYDELVALREYGAKPLGLAEPIVNSRGTVTNNIAWVKQLFEGIDESKEEGQLILSDSEAEWKANKAAARAAKAEGWEEFNQNWVGTRYIEWTTWRGGVPVWSHATSYRAVEGDGSGLEPGTRWRISCQGESDGMGTFAHEFGHIRDIADNYNNQFQTDPFVRTYVGNWELMGAGDKSGPYGTHDRYKIPSTTGDVVPSNHNVRLKIKQGFYEEDQYRRVDEEALIANGPVFETIVARNVPTAGKLGVGYGMNGLIIDMDADNGPIIAQNAPEYKWNDVGRYGSMRNTKYEGYYQFYSFEVVQRTGYESFMTDEGVLLMINREIDNESSPWSWVIDSHPEDINMPDFIYPDGRIWPLLKGKNDQLADALFHAGTGDDVVSEYVDADNNLHFYVLDYSYDAQGVLSYRVAARSDEFNGTYSDAMTVVLGEASEGKAGKVAVQEIKITNKGTQTGLYRLSTENDRNWDSMLSYEVIEVKAGETVTVPLYIEVPEFRALANDFSFTVTSEVSDNSATVEGTIVPPTNEPVYTPYEGVTESVLPAFDGKDVKDMPEVDPISWQVPEWMTWADWKDNPAIDWSAESLPDAQLQKGLLMLVDYADSPFIVTKELGSDPLGNPQIQVDTRDLTTFWEEFLNVPCEMNNYVSIDGFWRENSFGKWKVEVEAYGPYTLEGMEWEYGIDSFNGARSSMRAIRPEATALFLADKENHGRDLSDFTFGFIIHAGYDESGIWQEAGEMMFESAEAVPEEFGPTLEELESIRTLGAKPLGLAEPKVDSRGRVTNDITWAKDLFDGIDTSKSAGQLLIIDGKQGLNSLPTRYVPWTSWLAAKSIWSSASGVTTTEGDGSGLPAGTYFRISIQGESDGMATFAHEFGHIKEIGDNYNNPFGIPDGRSYTGPWELMSRGSFAGPVGTHTRWMTPGTEGSSVPAQHTTRLKLKQDFYEDDQYSRLAEEKLIANGPVFETIVARNIPTSGQWGIGYGVNSLIVDMDKDNTPIVTKSSPDYNWKTSTWGSYNSRNPYYGEGYYQFYSMEVVQRVGYDSFSPDEGVLIIMNREIDNESAPFMWVIDAHDEDIDLEDFTRPDGTTAMVSKGDARQLADALFHVGNGEDVVNEYFDEYNNLHFYVLDKMYDDMGVLSYRVAVRSDEFTGSYNDAMSVELGDVSPAKAGNVAVQEVLITNEGTETGLYRLAVANDEAWNAAFASNIVEVPAGETVSVALFMEVPDFRPADNDFVVTVESEVSAVSASVEGTIEPSKGEGVVRPSDDEDDEDEDTEAPEIVEPVSELPFVDVAVNAWFYNDVLVAWKDGLVNGRTETTYVPDGNITIAEAIKLASTMHQKYTAGAVTLTNGAEAWYSTYVEYAVANGIIKDGEYTDMNAIATRAQFASIFAAALPADALTAINAVEDGKIPDVKMADSYGAAVYKLYNAGILTGNDAVGTFAPMSNIKRSEVAAIVNRMMHVENRKTIAL